MSLTKKERIRRTLLHESVDKLPTQINYSRALGQEMARHYGVSEQDLPEHFGNHLVRVSIEHNPKFSEDGKVEYDWWGVGFSTQEEGYFAMVNPLSDSKDLGAYPWPDPTAPELLNAASQIIRNDAGQHFIVPNFGFALFERAWTMLGFENFLKDMVRAPSFVEELLERILEIQLVLIRRFIELGVDGGYFGDDYGAQRNMLFSPQMWRKFIKPRLARMFTPFREAGLPVLLHTDGQIQPIIPDLIEIGLTALNPIQPEVLDFNWLRSTFGNSLAYYGGISTQTVLPHGSAKDVKEAVDDCVAHLAPEGTGLIVAPSHRMMTDISFENIDALLDAFSRLGG